MDYSNSANHADSSWCRVETTHACAHGCELASSSSHRTPPSRTSSSEGNGSCFSHLSIGLFLHTGDHLPHPWSCTSELDHRSYRPHSNPHHSHSSTTFCSGRWWIGLASSTTPPSAKLKEMNMFCCGFGGELCRGWWCCRWWCKLSPTHRTTPPKCWKTTH